MDDIGEDILLELQDLKRKAESLKKKVLGTDAASEAESSMPDMDELREMIGLLIEKQNKMESTFGIEKVSLKDVGDRIMVSIETNFGQIITHAEKGSHSPVTYSGSTVAGGGGPAPGLMGAKGAGPHGMTPEQLQEFKKQSLQIAAAQQKLKELETKLNEAAMLIKKGQEKSTDMEEKEAENVKELYTCLEAINTSLSEKIALQKVEVQKIAGDTPKPINYDPFNYGEAYAGDLVDFQARKRITELKLLVQGLQSALLQMRDSMKVSPSIDLGYKVVRLDQLVESTGFGQKVDNGEVGPDEVLVVEQSRDRVPGRVEFPRKDTFQTSQDMESKWAITDSIMQTMYRLEMELGEIQKIIDSTGMSSGSKVIEEVQQSIKQLKDKQIDLKTVKRLIEDSKDSSTALMNVRKSGTTGMNRPTLPTIGSEASEPSLTSTRKMEQNIRQMQTVINSISHKMSGSLLTSKQDGSSTLSAAVTKRHQRGRQCLSCDRSVRGEGHDVPRPPLPLYSFFSPTGVQPRVRGPVSSQYTLNRVYNVELTREKPEVYTIPRACGAGYNAYWPLPKSFDATRFQAMYEVPAMTNDTKYIKGTDGRYYKGHQIRVNTSHWRTNIPVSILEATSTPKPPFRYPEKDEFKVKRKESSKSSGSGGIGDVAVVVEAASVEDANVSEDNEEELKRERDENQEMTRRASVELKKYKFVIGRDEDDSDMEDDGKQARKTDSKEGSLPPVEEGARNGGKEVEESEKEVAQVTKVPSGVGPDEEKAQVSRGASGTKEDVEAVSVSRDLSGTGEEKEPVAVSRDPSAVREDGQVDGTPAGSRSPAAGPQEPREESRSGTGTPRAATSASKQEEKSGATTPRAARSDSSPPGGGQPAEESAAEPQDGEKPAEE